MLPWRALLALSLALAAQQSLEPRDGREWALGLLLYLVAGIWMAAAFRQGELAMPRPPLQQSPAGPFGYRRTPLVLAMLLAVVTFAGCGGNRFTLFNTAAWCATLALLVYALWVPASPARLRLPSCWWLLVLAAVVTVFFRFHQFGEVPSEMFSDHAEKLLDVAGILRGETLIFFPRNTGREAFQMYLTAVIGVLTGTGLSFAALKIGTILAGLATLPFLYLLGRELGSRQTGLWAMLLAGFAYWPNVISRVGLRFPLAPLFWAPAFYYLLRGLRTGRRNLFVASGLCVGLGLYGYSPFRVAPFVIVLTVVIYLAHRQLSGARRQVLTGLAVIIVVAFAVFLPLLRYTFEHPDNVAYRVLTRLGTLERPLPGAPGWVFLTNLDRALAMFAWNDGNSWVNSVALRPALDVVSGALFHLGVLLVGLRYWRRRRPLDLALLLSIPMLLLPSVLALAFPDENPALNRAAMALVPVFLISGLTLDTLVRTVRARLGAVSAVALAGVLVVWSAGLNYDLVFHQYRSSYDAAAWNTLEMGRTVAAFVASGGSEQSAWMVSYKDWADGRLVGINAGFPLRDCSILPQRLSSTLSDRRAQLFLLSPQDSDGLAILRRLYPQGVTQICHARVPTREYVAFHVAASGLTQQGP